MPGSIEKFLFSHPETVHRLDRELLLAHVLDKPREYIFAHLEIKLTAWQHWRLKRLRQKRAVGVPLAYLTGHKEFYSLDFFVNKDVLIPRPETELMVELAIQAINTQETRNKKQILLIDVGPGSGCIPIAIMKTLQHQSTQTPEHVIAIDISKRALHIAKKNAKRHNINIQFIHGNLLGPIIHLPKTYRLRATSYQLIITANLPYLTQAQFAAEPSIQNEPRFALVAGNGGLALYEELLKQIKQLLTAYSLLLTAFFEIDPSQSSHITALIKQSLPSATIEIKKDLAGRDRVVIIHLHSQLALPS